MGKCSLCGSPGTTVSSCPLNPSALSPNPKKHPLAAPKTPQVQEPIKKIRAKLAVKAQKDETVIRSKPIRKIKAVVKARQDEEDRPKAADPILIKAKLKPKPKPVLTKEQCIKWKADVTVNPLTGRIIKIGSPTFMKFQNACVHYGININAKEGSWTEVYGCKNDSDPVGGDQYAQLQEDEVSNLIRLGSGMCYPLDTLYGWYKAKVQEGEDGVAVVVTDPMVPSYVLTADEIAMIDQYMSERLSSYQKPQPKPVKHPPVGHSLIVNQDWVHTPGFHRIEIKRPDGSIRIIGVLPMMVDGSGGVSSYSVMQKLYNAWNKGILMQFNDPEGITGLHILDASASPFNYDHVWWNGSRYDFIMDPMFNDEIRDAIISNLQQLDMDLDYRFWEN